MIEEASVQTTAWKTTRPRFAMTVALSWVAACASSGARETYEPAPAPVVLPAEASTYLHFDQNGVSQRRGDAVEWKTERALEGQPSAAGIDLEGGWACVGYSDQLAFIQIGASEADWAPSPQPGLYRSIAVRSDVAAITANNSVHLVEIPTGAVLDTFAAGDWIGRLDQDDVDYALPVSDAEVILLTSRRVGTFTDGKVVAIRADKSKGNWQVAQEQEIPGMTWVHRCASAGGALYVAGLREETRLRANRAPDLLQFLKVFRIDTETLRHEELVFERRNLPPPPTIIRDIAVGTEALALLLEPGEIRVYSLERGTLIREQYFASVDFITWIDTGELVVSADGELQVIRY